MNTELSEKQFLQNYKASDYDVPLTTVDMAIFSIIDQRLHVLLVERDTFPEKNKIALPGGFIDLNNDQDLDQTALRKLQEKTGVKLSYLEQVESVGTMGRDPRGWSVTILYFALIDATKISETLFSESTWFPLEVAKQLPLAFDHHILLAKAAKRLRAKTRYTALPIALLPPKFTLTELQTIFEIILDKKLPIKSFRKRLLDAHTVSGTGESKISGKRSAQLFISTGLDKDFHFPRPLQD